LNAGTRPKGASLAAGSLEQSLERLLERRASAAYEAGLAAGRDAEHSALGAAFEAALARLDAAREEALARIGHTSVELALEIARQLLRVEIPAGSYDLEGIVRHTLGFADVGRGRCVVHVHPVDAERLAQIPFRAGTEIEPDAGVAPGSVHVTTPQGLLVRDHDEALRSIGERLLEDLP
jgi:flagellar biosynthesis/type III secretory pathway protein FliH